MTPTLALYPGEDGVPSFSPPCAKIVLALAYSQLPHTLRPVFGSARATSPTGRLPALHLGDEVLCDSVAILDRIEALNPPRPISPSEPVARAHDRVWEHYANDTLYWQGLYLRWCVPENHARLMDFLLGKRRSVRKLIARPLLSREVFRRAKGQGIGLKSESEVRAGIERSFQVVSKALPAEGFLGGRPNPGRGDFALAALVCQADFKGLTPKLAGQVAAYPRLTAHMRTVFAACALPAPAPSAVARSGRLQAGLH